MSLLSPMNLPLIILKIKKIKKYIYICNFSSYGVNRRYIAGGLMLPRGDLDQRCRVYASPAVNPLI